MKRERRRALACSTKGRPFHRRNAPSPRLPNEPRFVHTPRMYSAFDATGLGLAGRVTGLASGHRQQPFVVSLFGQSPEHENPMNHRLPIQSLCSGNRFWIDIEGRRSKWVEHDTGHLVMRRMIGLDDDIEQRAHAGRSAPSHP